MRGARSCRTPSSTACISRAGARARCSFDLPPKQAKDSLRLELVPEGRDQAIVVVEVAKDSAAEQVGSAGAGRAVQSSHKHAAAVIYMRGSHRPAAPQQTPAAAG